MSLRTQPWFIYFLFLILNFFLQCRVFVPLLQQINEKMLEIEEVLALSEDKTDLADYILSIVDRMFGLAQRQRDDEAQAEQNPEPIQEVS